MEILYALGSQGSKKTTRINMLLQKFIQLLSDESVKFYKGAGRGPNFEVKINPETHEEYRADVCQKYRVVFANKEILVRFRSSGDSKETVVRNVDSAREEHADILITATHEEGWIRVGQGDCKRGFVCNASELEDQVKEMSDLLWQELDRLRVTAQASTEVVTEGQMVEK